MSAHSAWSCFASALAERHLVVRETDAAAALACRPQLRAAAFAGEVVVPPPSQASRATQRLLVMRQIVAGSAPVGGAAARSPLWRRVFRTLELQRTDAAIARAFAGARADLARLRADTLVSRPPLGPPTDARRVLEALLRWALGGTPPSHAALQLAALAARTAASALDSARTAGRICDLLCPRWRSRHATGDAPDDDALEAGMATPEGAGGTPPCIRPDLALPAQAHAAPGAGSTGPLADDLADTATWAVAAAHDLPSMRTRSSPRSARAGAQSAPEGRAHAVDEWDWRAQRFLPGWCTLYEQRASGGDARFIEGVRRRHAALAREVHRRFAALKPEALQRVHGAHDGDELELDRVIEAHVERRAGRTSRRAAPKASSGVRSTEDPVFRDRALYLRRDRAQRDVCTVFLVDTSASTDFVLRDPQASPPAPPPSRHDDEVYLYAGALAPAAAPGPPPRRVIDVAKDALALMCDALQTLGDRFAVYAFSGHGRAQVELRIVKDFDDAVSGRTAAALAALRPRGATRSGAAIRHAAARLARQPQRHKVLIVVSDGYPEDIDYGPEPRELRYAIEDTAHALREAAAFGIDTFNLSIDPAGHDYLRRICAPQRYLVIGDVAALPGELTKVYQAMTDAA